MPPKTAAKLLEPVLGYTFVKPELLDLALTHSSWANECGMAAQPGQIGFFAGNLCAVNNNLAILHRFQAVDGLDKRGLSRT